jgi:hypothetical protein
VIASLRAKYHEWLYDFLKDSFPFWQKLGFHVTPNHFYQPIPDTRTLGEELWRRQSALPGVRLNEERQVALLDDFVASFREEYEALPRERTPVPYQYYVNNGMFESVDGEILYCMVRRFQPSRIVEIGSGNSTLLSAQALLKNRAEGARDCELIAVEPYPNGTLLEGFPGLSRVVPARVQDVPLSEFDRLGADDILFIDSSHVLKIGGDVQYEYLELLPRLRPGVLVHVHDIFLPAEYPRSWVIEESRFWTEQYLLQAFLAFNDSFEVLWAGSYMHLRQPDRLEAAFGSYQRERRWPGSFWMRKVR